MIRRREVILGTLGGAPHLFWHGITLLTAGLLSFAIPLQMAATAYLVQPVLAPVLARLTAPIAGAVPVSRGNELRPLLYFVGALPLLALPLGIVMAFQRPHDVPLVTGTLIGAHLLPAAWLMNHRSYALGGLAIVLAVAALGTTLGRGAFHFVGLVIGAGLIAAALPAFRYAQRMTQRSVD